MALFPVVFSCPLGIGVGVVLEIFKEHPSVTPLCLRVGSDDEQLDWELSQPDWFSATHPSSLHSPYTPFMPDAP